MMSDVAYVRLADLSTRFSMHLEAVESYPALYGSTVRITSTCENVIPCSGSVSIHAESPTSVTRRLRRLYYRRKKGVLWERRRSSSECKERGTSDVVCRLMKEWPERSRTIPTHGDPTSFFFVEMYTSIPCELPTSANVTLLGDAIHAMTPTLGRGANTAMRDGALLGLHLEEVAHGRRTLPEAIREYETHRTQYDFDVVKKSAALGERLIGQNSLP